MAEKPLQEREPLTDSESEDEQNEMVEKIMKQVDEKLEKRFDKIVQTIELLGQRKRRREDDDDDEPAGNMPRGNKKRTAVHDEAARDADTACADSRPLDTQSDADPDVLEIREQDSLEELENSLTSNDDILSEIQNEYENMKDEPTGENLKSSKLTEIVNGRFDMQSQLSEEKLKQKFEAYNRPDSCYSMRVPLVNPEIWKKLKTKPFAKKNDLSLAHVERTMVKAATAVARLADVLTEEKADTAKIRLCTDAIALLGHANRELAFRRREVLKPALAGNTKKLCDEKIVPTKWLFGSDLSNAYKEVKAMDRLEADVAGTSQGQSGYHHNNRSQFGHGGRGAFLGPAKPQAQGVWHYQSQSQWHQHQSPSWNNQRGRGQKRGVSRGSPYARKNPYSSYSQ